MTNKLLKEIEEDIEKLKDIFDYYLDNYGLPEDHSEFNFENLLKNIKELKEKIKKDESCEKGSSVEKINKDLLNVESFAIVDLIYVFILNYLSELEEEIQTMNIRRKNFINIKDKIKKFREKKKNKR